MKHIIISALAIFLVAPSPDAPEPVVLFAGSTSVVPSLRDAPPPNMYKVENGRKVCSKKNDKPSMSKKYDHTHLDMECCLDPDEIPNPHCYYPPEKYGKYLQKYNVISQDVSPRKTETDIPLQDETPAPESSASSGPDDAVTPSDGGEEFAWPIIPIWEKGIIRLD